jgi:hypothetical protein
MGVDVVPNEAFSIPFVKEKALRYRQQFSLYDNSFWMPADIRIDVSAKISFAIISIPKISFTQTSVITNYNINTTIPDSIFKKPRLSVDTLSAATLDSSFWKTNVVLPLTLEETEAYKTLDSTKTLEVQFRPRGFAINIGAGDSGSVSAIEHLDVYFNRVEGVHLGLKNEFDKFSNVATINAGFAYGFSDKRWKYNIGATIFTSPKKPFGIGGEFYRRTDHRFDAGYYGALYNSFTSLIAKNDYRDYFETEGWRAFFQAEPSKVFAARFSFVHEQHISVQQNSDFSIFARSRSYRINPPIYDGKLRSLLLDARIGSEPTPFDIVRSNSLELHFEHSGEGGSNWNFNRVWGTGTISIPTFSRSLLLPQSLSIRVAAGTSSGELPPQRLFDLESASSNYAPFGVFRAMNVKEFSGTSFVALTLEHNFRSVPFLALGIPFLYENNIEFIVHGGVAQTWSQQRYVTLRDIAVFPNNITDGWYSEVGFGFSRIFDVLRADFTWRLSEPKNFRFTLGVANLF